MNKRDKNIATNFAHLIDNEYIADIIFLFPDKKVIHAHSFVIEASCPEFYQIIENAREITKSDIQLVNIKCASYEVFMIFITFLYTNKFKITSSQNAYEVYKLFKIFNINTKKIIDKVICKKVELICILLQYAINDNWQQMIDISLEHISKNFVNVIKSIEILNVDCHSFQEIMKLHPAQSDVNKRDIFVICVEWASHQCFRNKIKVNDEDLRKYFENIWDYIGFMKMTIEEFEECLKMKPGLFNDEEIIRIISIIARNSKNPKPINIRKIYKILYKNVEHKK